MYIARLSRLDLLLATAYQATKAQHPKDHKAALRIISFMKATINHWIKIVCKELKFHFHCDASWAFHHDASSHTGWILKMGDSFLRSKRSKQRSIIDRRWNHYNSWWILNELSRLPWKSDCRYPFFTFTKITWALPKLLSRLQKQNRSSIYWEKLV